MFGGLYRCVWDLYTQYRATTKRVERTRVGYLALGGFVATTLTLTDVLPRFGVAWPAIGNVLGILYLYFLSQTLFRNRLLDLNELVGKMAVLGTLVVLLSAVYGFLLYWIGGGQQGLYLLNALVAAFVILILFEPVRSWLENGINRWLLRQRTELRGRLDAVRRELPGVVDVPDMVAADHHRARGVAARHRRRRCTCSTPTAPASIAPASSARRRPSGSTPTPSARCSIACAPATSSATSSRASSTSSARPPTPSRAAPPLVALRSRVDELHAALIFPLFGSAETEQGPWLLGLFCVRDDRTDERVRRRRHRHVSPARDRRRARDRIDRRRTSASRSAIASPRSARWPPASRTRSATRSARSRARRSY